MATAIYYRNQPTVLVFYDLLLRRELLTCTKHMACMHANMSIYLKPYFYVFILIYYR